MTAIRILSIVIGYAAGLFPTGRLVGRAHETDLSKEGSGNTGMTNSVRVLGWRAGMLVFVGDFVKTVLPMIIMWLVWREKYPEFVRLTMLYAGLGAIIGHNFPFYAKFKGGKGIVCSVGTIVFFDWRLVPICAALFFGTVIPTGFMSIGSLGILGGFFVQMIVFGQLGLLHIGTQFLLETYIVAGVLTGVGFFMHRENIKRLATGSERKFSPGSSGKEGASEETGHPEDKAEEDPGEGAKED